MNSTVVLPSGWKRTLFEDPRQRDLSSLWPSFLPGANVRTGALGPDHAPFVIVKRADGKREIVDLDPDHASAVKSRRFASVAAIGVVGLLLSFLARNKK